ncbi:MAG: mitomycin antibiotic biosynthesis protein [Planctomycetota bacterium]|nr:MAG: mitomycin antibiotic biosynthesis protein [Planctomycetota bacterium]
MLLSNEQIQQFRTKGVLIAPNILTESDLQPVIDEINDYVDRKAYEFFNKDKISSTFADLPFELRISKIYAECKEVVQEMDIMSMRGKAMHKFLSNSNLLDAVENLIGSEITCSPIQHLRAKMPNNACEEISGLQGVVPWHQDAGVTSEEAENSDIVTCWIPLLDATKEMGCMEVIQNAANKGYLEHISSKEYGTTIRPDLIPKNNFLVAECPKGGVVFMTKYTPHRGLQNNSNLVRWNIDLRFQKTGTPTGRAFYPDFPVRSKHDILQMANDHAQWSNNWEESIGNSKEEAFHPRVSKTKFSI